MFLSDFSRAMIRWIPEHLIGHTGYSVGALREASMEMRQAADRLDNAIARMEADIAERTAQMPSIQINRVFVSPPDRDGEAA